MKQEKTSAAKSTSRRKFLSLGFLGGAALFGPGKATGQMISQATEDDEDTIPMLTPDGQLVQVPRSAVESSQERKKTGNKGILSWIKLPDLKNR